MKTEKLSANGLNGHLEHPTLQKIRADQPENSGQNATINPSMDMGQTIQKKKRPRIRKPLFSMPLSED